ncbi:twin-arginine translocase subunit TatC [Infirmifilum sp.]|uniref:twin-arginine translocase subunit TatC n=1 Tax=Infirmifilum sp. TaxID=2856575 RepID=UPI003D0D0114
MRVVHTGQEEELPEKPLLEHVYDLLETIRRILILHVAFILLLLLAPAPNELPRSYYPILFYAMNITKTYMLDFQNNLFAYPFAKLFGVTGSSVVLIAHGWFDSLTASLYLAALITIAFLAPVTVYYLYKFIEPGLYSHEKRIVKKYIYISLGLFLSGVIYGFFVVMPIVFATAVWIATLGGASLFFSIEEFYNDIFIGSLATGVFFMFPLALLTLHKIGIVNYETLNKNWRIIVFAGYTFLALLTPDPTPFSDLALGIPFVGLYFLSMWLIKRAEEKEKH